MKDIWNQLIEISKWSSSVHNMQPWRVKVISENESEVFYESRRLLEYEDANNLFSILSFGIFFETIKIAAANLGYDLSFELLRKDMSETNQEYVLFAKLKLAKDSEIQEEFSIDDIKNRKTNRRRYTGKKIPQDQIEEIKKLAEAFGNEFNYTEKPEDIKYLQQVNQKTLFYDLADDKVRIELRNWMRFSTKEAETKRDGLWAKCFLFPGWLMSIFFSHQWIINLPIFKQIVEMTYIRSTGGASNVAWLTAKFEKAEDLINNGRMLCRLWLKLHKLGIATHPYGSIVTNAKANDQIKKYLNIHEGDKKFWLIFRLGYAKTPPRSLRLDTKNYFIK